MMRSASIGIGSLVMVFAAACADEAAEVDEQAAAVSATERFAASASVMTAFGAPLASREVLVDSWGQGIVARLVADESCASLSLDDALTASISLDDCTASQFGLRLSGDVELSVELSPVRLFIALDQVRTPAYTVHGWAAVFARDFDRGELMLEGSVSITADDATTWLALHDVSLAAGDTSIVVDGAGYRESVDDAAHMTLDGVRWDARDCLPRAGVLSYADVSVAFGPDSPVAGAVALTLDGQTRDAIVRTPCWEP